MPRHGQHGRIAEMEKHHGGKENQQVSPTEQIAERDKLALIIRVLAAACAFVVYLSRVNEGDDTGACNCEGTYKVENPVIADILAEHPSQTCRHEIAPVVEALIAADPRVEPPPPDQAKGQRCDRGWDHRRG